MSDRYYAEVKYEILCELRAAQTHIMLYNKRISDSIKKEHLERLIATAKPAIAKMNGNNLD